MQTILEFHLIDKTKQSKTKQNKAKQSKEEKKISKTKQIVLRFPLIDEQHWLFFIFGIIFVIFMFPVQPIP
jgi:hypothetical protein